MGSYDFLPKEKYLSDDLEESSDDSVHYEDIDTSSPSSASSANQSREAAFVANRILLRISSRRIDLPMAAQNAFKVVPPIEAVPTITIWKDCPKCNKKCKGERGYIL
jgi:hypothetical protein